MPEKLHRFKSEFFKTLAHPVRLAILEHLRSGEKSVGQLQTSLNMDQSAVSQQLARLRMGYIVDCRKVGTTVYYSVTDPMVFNIIDIAHQIFNNQVQSMAEERDP